MELCHVYSFYAAHSVGRRYGFSRFYYGFRCFNLVSTWFGPSVGRSEDGSHAIPLEARPYIDSGTGAFTIDERGEFSADIGFSPVPSVTPPGPVFEKRRARTVFP